MAEWTTLRNAIGGAAVAGGLLKEIGFAHWNAPNTGATDAHGYRLMGNGNRWVDLQAGDGFDSLLEYSDTWSADAHDATDGDSVYAADDSAELYDYFSEKYGGMAVRACRDV